MIDWNSIIWFVIWAAVVIAGLLAVVWLIFTIASARMVNAARKDFDKGFESDFFKRHRN